MAGNTKRFFEFPRGMAQLLLGVNILVFRALFVPVGRFELFV